MALKEMLLGYFDNHPDVVSSGEELAKMFHVSRAAVWKAIGSLKEDGFEIESVPGKGYVYSRRNDILRKESIYEAAGRNDFAILLFDEIDSTNTYGRKLAAGEARDGTFIVANSQSAGRGRQGHSFYSPSGTGLYATYLLRVQKPAQAVLKTTIAAAVACQQAIAICTGLSPKIKWVNDIFIDKAKVAGILCEATQDLETHMVDWVIVGVGINIKTSSFPEEIKDIAGSLGVDDLSRNKLAGVLYDRIDYWTHRLEDPMLLEIYRRESLLVGKQIRYEKNGNAMEGIAVGINEEGNLLVRNMDGTQVALSSGEVSVKDWG